jgi:hypothetical protein
MEQNNGKSVVTASLAKALHFMNMLGINDRINDYGELTYRTTLWDFNLPSRLRGKSPMSLLPE